MYPSWGRYGGGGAHIPYYGGAAQPPMLPAPRVPAPGLVVGPTTVPPPVPSTGLGSNFQTLREQHLQQMQQLQQMHQQQLQSVLQHPSHQHQPPPSIPPPPLPPHLQQPPPNIWDTTNTQSPLTQTNQSTQQHPDFSSVALQSTSASTVAASGDKKANDYALAMNGSYQQQQQQYWYQQHLQNLQKHGSKQYGDQQEQSQSAEMNQVSDSAQQTPAEDKDCYATQPPLPPAPPYEVTKTQPPPPPPKEEMPPPPPPEEAKPTIQPPENPEEAERLKMLQAAAAQWQQQRIEYQQQTMMQQHNQLQQLLQQYQLLMQQIHHIQSLPLEMQLRHLEMQQQQFIPLYQEWQRQFQIWKAQLQVYPNKDQLQQYETQWNQWQEQMVSTNQHFQERMDALRNVQQQYMSTQPPNYLENTSRGLMSQTLPMPPVPPMGMPPTPPLTGSSTQGTTSSPAISVSSDEKSPPISQTPTTVSQAPPSMSQAPPSMSQAPPPLMSQAPPLVSQAPPPATRMPLPMSLMPPLMSGPPPPLTLPPSLMALLPPPMSMPPPPLAPPPMTMAPPPISQAPPLLTTPPPSQAPPLMTRPPPPMTLTTSSMSQASTPLSQSSPAVAEQKRPLIPTPHDEVKVSSSVSTPRYSRFGQYGIKPPEQSQSGLQFEDLGAPRFDGPRGRGKRKFEEPGAREGSRSRFDSRGPAFQGYRYEGLQAKFEGQGVGLQVESEVATQCTKNEAADHHVKGEIRVDSIKDSSGGAQDKKQTPGHQPAAKPSRQAPDNELKTQDPSSFLEKQGLLNCPGEQVSGSQLENAEKQVLEKQDSFRQIKGNSFETQSPINCLEKQSAGKQLEKQGDSFEGQGPNRCFDMQGVSNRIESHGPGLHFETQGPGKVIEGQKPSNQFEGQVPGNNIKSEGPSSRLEGPGPGSCPEGLAPSIGSEGYGPSHHFKGQGQRGHVKGHGPGNRFDAQWPDGHYEGQGRGGRFERQGPGTCFSNFEGPRGHFEGQGMDSGFQGPGGRFDNQGRGHFEGPGGGFVGPSGPFKDPDGHFEGQGGIFESSGRLYDGPGGRFESRGGRFEGHGSHYEGRGGRFEGADANFDAPGGHFDVPGVRFDSLGSGGFESPGGQFEGQGQGGHSEGLGRGGHFEGQGRGGRFEGHGRGSRFVGQVRGGRFEGPGRGSHFEGQGRGGRLDGQGHGSCIDGLGRGGRHKNHGRGSLLEGPGSGNRFEDQGPGGRFGGQGPGKYFEEPNPDNCFENQVYLEGQDSDNRFENQGSGVNRFDVPKAGRFDGPRGGYFEGPGGNCLEGQGKGTRFEGQAKGNRFEKHGPGHRFEGSGPHFEGPGAAQRFDRQVLGQQFEGPGQRIEGSAGRLQVPGSRFDGPQGPRSSDPQGPSPSGSSIPISRSKGPQVSAGQIGKDLKGLQSSQPSSKQDSGQVKPIGDVKLENTVEDKNVTQSIGTVPQPLSTTVPVDENNPAHGIFAATDPKGSDSLAGKDLLKTNANLSKSHEIQKKMDGSDVPSVTVGHVQKDPVTMLPSNSASTTKIIFEKHGLKTVETGKRFESTSLCQINDREKGPEHRPQIGTEYMSMRKGDIPIDGPEMRPYQKTEMQASWHQEGGRQMDDRFSGPRGGPGYERERAASWERNNWRDTGPDIWDERDPFRRDERPLLRTPMNQEISNQRENRAPPANETFDRGFDQDFDKSGKSQEYGFNRDNERNREYFHRPDEWEHHGRGREFSPLHPRPDRWREEQWRIEPERGYQQEQQRELWGRDYPERQEWRRDERIYPPDRLAWQRERIDERRYPEADNRRLPFDNLREIPSQTGPAHVSALPEEAPLPFSDKPMVDQPPGGQNIVALSEREHEIILKAAQELKLLRELQEIERVPLLPNKTDSTGIPPVIQDYQNSKTGKDFYKDMASTDNSLLGPGPSDAPVQSERWDTDTFHGLWDSASDPKNPDSNYGFHESSPISTTPLNKPPPIQKTVDYGHGRDSGSGRIEQIPYGERVSLGPEPIRERIFDKDLIGPRDRYGDRDPFLERRGDPFLDRRDFDREHDLYRDRSIGDYEREGFDRERFGREERMSHSQPGRSGGYHNYQDNKDPFNRGGFDRPPQFDRLSDRPPFDHAPTGFGGERRGFSDERIPAAAPHPPHPPPRVEKKPESKNVDDILKVPGRQSRPDRIVVIMRGLPGSGKTHVAKLIRDKEVEYGGAAPRVLSLDDYFMTEVEKVVKDPDSGKRVKKKVLEYEYEPEMEDTYRSSMFKTFRKTLDDGFFPFIIVDAINSRIKHFEQLWSAAKTKGFEVYIAEMSADNQTCVKRNIHGRKLKEINKMADHWDSTPRHMLRLDIRSLLQDAAIEDVEMEDFDPSTEQQPQESEEQQEDESTKDAADEEEYETGFVTKSKWEMDTSEENLDKLDGLRSGNKRKRGWHDSIANQLENYLQLPDDYNSRSSEPGKKRVRWADLEEEKDAERKRAIGFVVGQTDWEKITDEKGELAQRALNRTKYF
ncbi:YLP motif-containing protein 1 isoform X2 [Amblyraja radiata]|uniref:YLP motif-containing protein 1 isoform X2 n=1 Tax=Amblyraja radiata TaxID=386614 RepID=UPI00140303D6|nr:YLP motif-containing protein 1 isoform X2 [Amblyraja radiata]